jgi:hypothetical protein
MGLTKSAAKALRTLKVRGAAYYVANQTPVLPRHSRSLIGGSVRRVNPGGNSFHTSLICRRQRAFVVVRSGRLVASEPPYQVFAATPAGEARAIPICRRAVVGDGLVAPGCNDVMTSLLQRDGAATDRRVNRMVQLLGRVRLLVAAGAAAAGAVTLVPE